MRTIHAVIIIVSIGSIVVIIIIVVSSHAFNVLATDDANPALGYAHARLKTVPELLVVVVVSYECSLAA